MPDAAVGRPAVAFPPTPAEHGVMATPSPRRRATAVAVPGTAIGGLAAILIASVVAVVALRPAPIAPGASPSLMSTPTPTAGPVATPAPKPTPPSVAGAPACADDDRPTPRGGFEDWPISMLDTILYLPAGYEPGDLVDTSAAGLNGGYLIRSLVVADLAALADNANANGTPIRIVSAYRSYEQQAATFRHWVEVGGYEQALRTSARPGHSEHQLGTVLDVTSLSGVAPWEYADWAATPAGAWMAANAWRYGFVMSYPRGSFAASCYDYEPWHYRYVGRDVAALIQADGRVPRLVLWELQ